MIIRIKILTGLVLCIVSSLGTAKTQLHITTGFTPPVSDFFNRVLSEADNRLTDISISFEVLPAERSLILANQGINDGECCRIPSIVSPEYKNLLVVEESFFSARFSAFGKKNSMPIRKFDDLKPFTVGSVEGWKIAVIKVKQIKPAEMHVLTTPEQLFKMIDQDRLDYGVVGYLSGLDAIAKLKLKNIQAFEPPLIEKQLYLLLHNKHKDLIPVFNDVLKQMKKDGSINKIYNELVESLQ